MSAFMVSTDHIDLIVDFARSGSPRDSYHLPTPPTHYGLTHTPDCKLYGVGPRFDVRGYPDELGQALLSANWESLNARYPGRVSELFGNSEAMGIANYRAPRRPRIFGAYPLKRDAEIGHVLKQLECFDYQACEVSDYDASWAAGVINILRRKAISQLTGYAAAPWGL